MGFIMEGLDAEDYDRTYGDRVLVQRIAGYFRPHIRKMLMVAVMVLLFSLTETILPIVMARGIDALAGDPSQQLLITLAGTVLVLGVIAWGFNYVHQILAAQAVGDVVLAIRQDAFKSVVERDLSFYDHYASGKIVSRVTSDTQDFSSVVTLTMQLMSQLVMLVIMSIVLLVIEPVLGLITLLIAPLIIFVALGFRRIARWTSQRTQRINAEVNSIIQETISGIAVAKSFRQEAAIYDDFSTTNRLAYRVNLQTGLVFSSIFPLLDTLSGIGVAVVIYFGGLHVTVGSVSTGDWYLFVRALEMFYIPLTSVASFWSQFQQGLAASERVFALIDAEPRVVQVAQEPVTHMEGRITFRDVNFSYVGVHDNAPVLNGFSLDIPAGQKIAIVGHTGAGKSSLVRLIARFYEFQSGALLIDGRDIRCLDLSEYHQCMGVVPQVPFLFSGTVADNIRYGRPDASDEEVRRVAEMIGAGAWLDDLPEGLQTDVGERGARLSLGQRQLVALARVLLQNAAIFMLDEATASIDPFTEAQIQESLDVVMQGRTSIIIAHRLSTVKSVDRIIVMRAGQIIEEGNHNVLLAHGGHYAELYNTYFRHQSLEYIEQVGEYG